MLNGPSGPYLDDDVGQTMDGLGGRISGKGKREVGKQWWIYVQYALAFFIPFFFLPIIVLKKKN